MKGYKIYYSDQKKNWYEYDNIIYTDKKKALNVMRDAQEQFTNKTFELFKFYIK